MTADGSLVPRMGRAALVVSAGILLSRVLGFLREVVLAAILGATATGDAYDAAFVIPDFLFYLVAGGYLSITFIPILARYLAREDREGGWQAFTAVFRIVGLLVGLLTLAAFVFAESLVTAVYERFPDLIASISGSETGDGLAAEQIDQVVTLTRIALPAQIFFVLGTLLISVQYAHERFLIPTVAPIVYNLAIIVGGVVMRDSANPGAGFVWGALAGAFVGHFLIQGWGAARLGLHWVPAVQWGHPAVKEYILLSIPLMLGQSLVALEEQLVRVFAQFGDPGSIFALGRARRLDMLPVGVIAQAAGVAAYPFLARLAAEHRLRDLTHTLMTAIRYVILASLAATALLGALSQPIVRVALQRANFTPAATVLTASALVFHSLSITAWGVQQVYARGFYAKKQMWTPVLIGTTATIVAIPLMVLLAGGDMLGVAGLALASSIAVTGYAVALAMVWHRRNGTDEVSGVLSALGRGLVGAVVGGLAGWRVSEAILAATGPTLGGSAVAIVAGGLTVGLLYLSLNWLLGSPEIRQLAGRMSK